MIQQLDAGLFDRSRLRYPNSKLQTLEYNVQCMYKTYHGCLSVHQQTDLLISFCNNDARARRLLISPPWTTGSVS